jgi:predicted SprT family Zn-dependent metalloprotease
MFRSAQHDSALSGGCFLKQLEFLFVGGTRSPLRVDKISAAPPPRLTSPSERPIHLRERDHALETHARELLRALGANKLARETRVEWNPRLKTCAGRADYREKLISLNPLLLEGGTRSPLRVDKISAASPPELTSPAKRPIHLRSASDALALQFQGIDEIDRTLRHELAHLLAQWRAGRRRIAPHGAEWRQACRDFGIADEARCHNLPFATKVYPPRYVYRCPNCKEEFPRVRKIRRAIACLACCRKHNGGDFDPRFRLKLEGHAPLCP